MQNIQPLRIDAAEDNLQWIRARDAQFERDQVTQDGYQTQQSTRPQT